MKNLILKSLIAFPLFMTIANFSQSFDSGNYTLPSQGMTIQSDKNDSSENFKKIAPKMYESIAFSPAQVNGINKVFSLRYNLYTDEMEFTKNEEIIYLQKDEDRKITFQSTKETYSLFEFKNKLRYFMVHNNGETLLLRRKIVEYKEAKKATSGYDKDKPADFKRKNDEIYIKFKDLGLIEVPNNKKKFHEIFGENSSKIKKYMNQNKLKTKDIAELKMIIAYYNTL